MIALRRLALGFPITWSHRRGCSLSAINQAGAGPYFIQWDPGSGIYGEDWNDAPRDAHLVLLTGSRYHPIRIAQFALHRFGVWCATGDPSAHLDFLAQASWLRDHQCTGRIPGRYRFEFPWSKYGAGSGWTSAMAQGEAISVLLRAESITSGNGYGDAAARAALPFRHEIADGGVTWRKGSSVFFEEIANDHAPHVLNGCIFALWGLWELWMRDGERWQGELVEQSVDTLRHWLPKFDTGWWTLYSLMRTSTGHPHVATLKYHAFHIAQMHVLAHMFNERVFHEAAERWTSYAQRPTCRARLIGSTLRSLPERLLGRDTVAGGAHT